MVRTSIPTNHKKAQTSDSPGLQILRVLVNVLLCDEHDAHPTHITTSRYPRSTPPCPTPARRVAPCLQEVPLVDTNLRPPCGYNPMSLYQSDPLF